MSLKEFADTLPDYAKDLRLNLGSLLSDQMLGDQRKYGLLLACAHGTGYRADRRRGRGRGGRQADAEAANAARAAAAVMAMNNVYYRFVHLASNPEYGTLPAKLRMNVIGIAAASTRTISSCSASRSQRDERLRHVHRQP